MPAHSALDLRARHKGKVDDTHDQQVRAATCATGRDPVRPSGQVAGRKCGRERGANSKRPPDDKCRAGVHDEAIWRCWRQPLAMAAAESIARVAGGRVSGKRFTNFSSAAGAKVLRRKRANSCYGRRLHMQAWLNPAPGRHGGGRIRPKSCGRRGEGLGGRRRRERRATRGPSDNYRRHQIHPAKSSEHAASWLKPASDAAQPFQGHGRE